MPQRRRRARGRIRELPSGSFQAIVYAGKDPLTGKERYERLGDTLHANQAIDFAHSPKPKVRSRISRLRECAGTSLELLAPGQGAVRRS